MKGDHAMDSRTLGRTAAWILALALAVGLEPAIGQTPPTENKGVTIGKPTAIDLGSQVEGVQGRALRMRVITVEPGGVLGLHNHKDRPAVAYIIQGALTEHREGGGVIEHHAGESWSVSTAVTHWEENRGAQPLVLVAADLVKQ
jgi:quercetin dioxygenase-like cupin family protein